MAIYAIGEFFGDDPEKADYAKLSSLDYTNVRVHYDDLPEKLEISLISLFILVMLVLSSKKGYLKE